ncbi:uncharacterized protein [Clytia hemisphaerica]|uniref:uncharacterized protein isoform X3 n=1 Tax=Clytia hemisphaerica TaxID=252671 RepID=UPI0034D47DDC
MDFAQIILPLSFFFIITTHVETSTPSQWSLWGSWDSGCYSNSFRQSTRRRRSRSCPDDTCVGEEYSYMYDCGGGDITLNVAYSEPRSSRTTSYRESKKLTEPLSFFTKLKTFNMNFPDVGMDIDQYCLVSTKLNDGTSTPDGRCHSLEMASSNKSPTTSPSLYARSYAYDGVMTRMLRESNAESYAGGAEFIMKAGYYPVGTPSSSFTASQVVKISHDRMGEAYFVVHQVYQKDTASHPSDATFYEASSNYLSYEIPGQSIRYLAASYPEEGFITDVTITVYLPPQYDVKRGVERQVSSGYCLYYNTVQADVSKNAIIY